MTENTHNDQSQQSIGAEEEQTGMEQTTGAEDYQAETAAEVAPRPYVVAREDEERRQTAEANFDDGTATGRGVGVFALVLSILSLFFLPVLLGAAGIIVGFVARKNGATGLGNWAIGIGAVSIILTVFFSPFF